jgi:sporulation protein YunB
MRLKRRANFVRKHHLRRRVMIIVTVIVLVIGLVRLDARTMPLLRQYAENQAKWFATKAVNEAVTASFTAHKPSYNDLVTLTTADDNSVTSLAANTSAVNLLKSQVSLAILERIGEKECITVAVPLGTLLGSHYFTGRGPFVRIPIGASGSVLTDIKSEFISAGINQTRHRLILEVKTQIFLAVPTAHTSVTVDSSFIITESILLGKIPDAYTVVENIDEETVGEIFDYGAQIEK